jgi:hypothetical protein
MSDPLQETRNGGLESAAYDNIMSGPFRALVQSAEMQARRMRHLNIP